MTAIEALALMYVQSHITQEKTLDELFDEFQNAKKKLIEKQQQETIESRKSLLG